MIKMLKRMDGKERTLMGLVVICVILQVTLNLKVPDYMSEITSLVKTEGSSLDAIWHAGIMMLICALGSLAAAVITRYFSAKLGSLFSYRLREDVFQRVQAFSNEEINHFSTASLITRSTNDVRQLQNFISGGLQNIVTSPITIVIALIKIWGKQWQWTLFTCFNILLVTCALVFVIVYAHPRQRKVQGFTDNLNKVMRENMTGIRVIKAYNAEDFQQEKFEDANQRLTQNSLESRRAMAVMNPVMKFANNFLNIGIYVIGAFLIMNVTGSDEQLTIFSEMIVFSTYAAKIIRSFMGLNRIFMMIPRATVSAERINEILDTKPTIIPGKATQGKEGMEGTIEFKHVSFRYPDAEANALTDISFTANKGETVAFIGATGSSKSTLVNLIPRFYDVNEGEILVDGINVKDYDIKALHNIIGYTPQRALLFTGTVESNVNYGDNGQPKKEDISTSLKVAQADDFVSAMPNGAQSPISRGGTNVSGGQRQRLSIARTVQKDPEIYIFDDTFSALDYKTDKALRAALKEHTSNVTSLIVAQRIGTIRDANKIIVLEEGKIVGMGTHDELLQTCKVYQDIAYTQLTKEELANG